MFAATRLREDCLGLFREEIRDGPGGAAVMRLSRVDLGWDSGIQLGGGTGAGKRSNVAPEPPIGQPCVRCA